MLPVCPKEDLVTRARTQLLLRPDMGFFASLALNLPVVMTDSVGTAATDGKTLFFSPDFAETISKQDPDCLMAVVAHEVMHCALSHMHRRGSRDPSRWNFACDYAINSLLVDAGFRLPQGSLFNHAYQGQSAEQIYPLLPDTMDQDMSSRFGPKEQSWGDHSKWDEASSSSDVAAAHERKWKRHLSQAQTANKQRGFGTASIDRLVENILYPKLNYRDALAAYVQPQFVDYTFEPPDWRYDSDLILPDFGGEGLEDIVIAIDTSGSVYSLADQFYAETREILQSWNCLRIHHVLCDNEIQHWEILSGQEFLPNKVQGGGGTDFRPVFDRIQNEGLSPHVLIYLTDTYGAFPNTPPSYPVLWVSTESDVTVPFGTISFLEE